MKCQSKIGLINLKIFDFHKLVACGRNRVQVITRYLEKGTGVLAKRFKTF
jgi:hypothetical protein